MPTIFIPREVSAGETRVAATPETVKRYVGTGLSVQVESGAGLQAGLTDEVFKAAGAALVGREGFGKAEIVIKVAPPTPEEIALMRPETVLVAYAWPTTHLAEARRLAERKISMLAMDLVPRITRAQAMDALSSQAMIGGYKAVLLGATHLTKICPMLMTAAGTVPPARVVVFGAGVAGLMAIATAKRMGAQVEATDVRAASKEQVLSLGARFIEVPGLADMEGAGGYAKEAGEDVLRRQREEVAKRVAEADLVVTTARVPGKKAPLLVNEAMVKSMRPGSVIVDMAVESGGNCELSVEGETVVRHGVTIVGTRNLPATVPTHSSELYAKNILNLVKLFVGKEGAIARDFKDEVLAGCLLVHGGEIVHKATAEALSAGVKA
ncbi:MAG: Re/Si-specific NAD(P)(+) transhydrogenase subunit alpha [Planctomycetes bacterium]|jgi:NAD(P) transhydrogenase subunit alpha|nr:Re/Si-specific NAD(P)(+) transhydrogenase subunit alpha [Planctomycetota bacterium]